MDGLTEEDKIWEALKKQLNEAPLRFLEDKTKYREMALMEAGKLPNHTASQLLGAADKIYEWLLQEKTPAYLKQARVNYL